ncbi:MAG: hypothetical protein ACJA01_001634 [Saprospiraceae bacterium]|jgi:hypothetical protein
MKMKYFNPLLITFLCGCIQLSAIDIPLKEFKKDINKTFQFDSNDPNISLDNMYGNLTITSHSQKSATVSVEIIVEASKESRAQEIFDKIDIQMEHGGNKLSVITEINSSKGWNWTKKNEQYQINYIVALPTKSFLSIENKYGNVACANHENDINLVLKYGNGSLQNVGGNLDAELGYVGSFTIGSVEGNAMIDLSYSNLNMDSAHDVEIDSKYSSFSIENCGDVLSESMYDKYDLGSIKLLKNDGKYDTFKIIEAEKVNCETKYTNMKIGSLIGGGDFDFEYGGLNVKNVSPEATSISVEGKHTGVDLGISGAYSLDVEGKHTGLDYTRDLKISNRDKGDNEIMVQGYHINDSGTKIKARLRYGHLHL